MITTATVIDATRAFFQSRYGTEAGEPPSHYVWDVWKIATDLHTGLILHQETTDALCERIASAGLPDPDGEGEQPMSASEVQAVLTVFANADPSLLSLHRRHFWEAAHRLKQPRRSTADT